MRPILNQKSEFMIRNSKRLLKNKFTKGNSPRFDLFLFSCLKVPDYFPGSRGRIAFVEDVGEQLVQYLVHGVDVWLNNPQPPLEAWGSRAGAPRC